MSRNLVIGCVLIMVGILFYPPYLQRIGVHVEDVFNSGVLLFTYLSVYYFLSLACIGSIMVVLFWSHPNWWQSALLIVTLVTILGIPFLYRYHPAVVAAPGYTMYWPTQPALFEGVVREGQIESDILPTCFYTLVGWSRDGVLHYIEVSDRGTKGWAYMPGSNSPPKKEDIAITSYIYSAGSKVPRETILKWLRASNITSQEDENTARQLAVSDAGFLSPNGTWVAIVAHHFNGPDDVIVLKTTGMMLSTIYE